MEKDCEKCKNVENYTINEKLRFCPFSNFKKDKILNSLFQFFLYFAPTIDSKFSIPINDNLKDACYEMMLANRHFFGRYVNGNFKKADKYIISGNICLKCKRFICKKKESKIKEKDLDCFLRHIRNSIAHGNIFLVDAKTKSKLIILDDYTKKGNISSRIICLQSDLDYWRKTLIKFQNQ